MDKPSLFTPPASPACASAASAWGSQKVMSMARYSSMAHALPGNVWLGFSAEAQWTFDSTFEQRQRLGQAPLANDSFRHP
jgi:hypothetical protein